MTGQETGLNWTKVYNVASRTRTALSGDNISLPQSALEELLVRSSTLGKTNSHTASGNQYPSTPALSTASSGRDTHQELPYPLTFLLVNPQNDKRVYTGIKEFSMEENEIGLSPFLLEALEISTASRNELKDETDTRSNPGQMSRESIDTSMPQITVSLKLLPKGVYVRLRPLESGYDSDNWKSLLERSLRQNFTTLTNGKVLKINASRTQEFSFLIDKLLPAGDGICVINTDLEVDIEALNEEQARETLMKIQPRPSNPNTSNVSSTGGELNLWKQSEGKVFQGQYVDYILPSWDRSQGIIVEMSGSHVQLLVSPYSSHQRARPREDEHVWGRLDTESIKRITIFPSDLDLEKTEAIYISLHVHGSRSIAHMFSLQVMPLTLSMSSSQPPDIEKNEIVHDENTDQCKTCLQWIPKRSMLIHENFCARNNILCSKCQKVFKKQSSEWQQHWHCEFDASHGETLEEKTAHDEVFHTPRSCPHCHHDATNTLELAAHRTSVCPGKLILCQFCHLEVPQEGDPLNPSAETLITGLTAHEVLDGARTTECRVCNKIIRLRDICSHQKHHELENSNKSKPQVCRNMNCSRTLDSVEMLGNTGNSLGLCSMCFGPLYANIYDPEGKVLKRRIERRYLTQLISGCGKPWCCNEYCKTSRKLELTSRTALPIIKPLIQNLDNGDFYFCVDEKCQQARNLANMMAAEKVFELEWWIAALEVRENLDDAMTWLRDHAPKSF